MDVRQKTKQHGAGGGNLAGAGLGRGAERAERSGSHRGGKLMQPFWEWTTEPSHRGADGVYSGLTIRITLLNIRSVRAGGLEASHQLLYSFREPQLIQTVAEQT